MIDLGCAAESSDDIYSEEARRGLFLAAAENTNTKSLGRSHNSCSLISLHHCRARAVFQSAVNSVLKAAQLVKVVCCSSVKQVDSLLQAADFIILCHWRYLACRQSDS